MVSLAAILPIHADVAGGSSSGTPLTLNVTSTASLTAVVVPVTATTSVISTPLGATSGSAPSPYSTTGGPISFTPATTGVSLDASTGELDVDAGVNTIDIGATALTSLASSTVNGGAGSKSTTATAGVTGLNLGFGVVSATVDPAAGATIDVNSTALSITTGVITSTSTVTGPGDGSPLDASFSNSVADFNVSLFGVSILSFAPASIVADLAAGNPVNAVIDLEDVSIILPDGLSDLSASGLILISNAGTASDGILSGSASAIALNIGFQNINIGASVGGLITVQTQVNGIVSAANSSALQSVPEPSAALLSIGALTALVILRRRRSTL